MSNDEIPIDAKVLVAIGPDRVAALLAEVASTDQGMRRRLQFQLAAQKGEDVVAAIRQWISEFGEQTSFLDAGQVEELSTELDAMRVAIASSVSRVLPELAPDLMWPNSHWLAPYLNARQRMDGRPVVFLIRPALIWSR